MKMKKIFIILPHKDQFIKNYAGSASIKNQNLKIIQEYLVLRLIQKMYL